MDSIWSVLVALLGGWLLIAAALGTLIGRWLRMQRV